MAPVYRIRFTPHAAEQLQEIFDYIERDSTERASRLIGHLLAAIDALEQLPHRYKILENLDTGGVEVRSMPVPPYLVRYHVDDANQTVHVLSVRHGARRAGL
jgi:addiction module RelE/StbE family toxin